MYSDITTLWHLPSLRNMHSFSRTTHWFATRQKQKGETTRTPSHLYLIQYQGLTAIHQRGAGDIWQGLWELPQAEHLDSIGEDTWKGYAQLVCKDVKHVLTHQILLADLYLWTPQNRPPLPEDFIWSPTEALEDYAYPRLMEILIASYKEVLKRPTFVRKN